jgi:hypothetical protein
MLYNLPTDRSREKFIILYELYNFVWPPPPPRGATAPSGPGPPHYRGFAVTLRHHTR